MKKAVLIMAMPERCRDCKWCEHILKFCGINEEFMEDVTIRQDWCPLRELPERKNGTDYLNEVYQHPAFDYGWNACLDKINPQN